METYEFNQFSPKCCTVHVALIRSLSNAAQLLQDLRMKGAEAFPLQLALIDAAFITSKEHLLIAIHQSLLSYNRAMMQEQQAVEKHDQSRTGEVPIRGLKTKSIHSEVLWNLSISSNIMDSFRTFGVCEKTKDVIAVHIADQESAEPQQVLSLIMQVVQGRLDLEGLNALNAWKSSPQSGESNTNSPVDWDKVKKVYKLDNYTERRQIESLVTSMVAMKSVAA